MRLTRSPASRRSDGFSLIEVIVAMALMGIALVSLIQLFSGSLRATKKSSEYTRGLIYARSLMDEAYAAPSLEDIEGDFDFEDGYSAKRVVTQLPAGEEEEEAPPLYEITVTVTWPPRGKTVLKGTRVVYENEL